ncbi:putative Ig domain-containing protein [Pseudoxanthomonas mexicana]|uniref:putative Ig domain-containing protein n=1 Tax=Pseudoxanthomonas mexicana TaxID=128785 RepID=UPI0028A0DBFC|nr:putative Ig domain-containing protein [Pseudoxanthomonas mexicana]
MYTSSNRPSGRRLGTLAFLLLALAMLWPAIASAQTSTYCAAPLTATVSWGGSANIDVSNCDGPFDGGMSGPIEPFAQHGTVTLGPASGGTQFVAYAHNGSTPVGGGSDTIWLEDNDFGTVRIDITISAPTSAITVSPATLPTLTAGTPFSQSLTSSGGTSPYTYVLESGPLPVGLSLTGGGVLSGTPTQRGGYSFSVRSTDSAAPTADTVVKSYTGTVQNPTLTLTTPSGTAIQGAPFSQTLSTTGGVAPHDYQLETGAFPAGISISSAGVVSGTTTAAPGSYPVTLRVTDASTGPGVYYELENYTLTVSPPPSVSISVSPASVSEDGATNLTYTVTRSLNLTSPTTVNITTSGTATSGVDYTGGVATVVIPAGATTATITINPTVDGTVEADETVILTVAAGTGYTVGVPASATGNILNDDVPSATISVSPANVAEDGAPNLVYTVSLNQASFSALSINYTIGGTATNGTDYATIASPLVIPAGNTTGTITVNPTADATIEANETVILTLNAGAGYTVGVPNSATGTILNDDLPNLAINDVTANEGNAGITNFTFTVSLSAPAGPGGVTFDIATANGSATAGIDYVTSSLTGQTIPAGSSTYTFTVQVNGDTANEPSETFFVNVTNVVNAVVVDGQGVGTVVNDDPLPSLSIDDVSVVEGNAGTVNAVFTVTLSAASGQTATVLYATADGTATQPADYTSTSGSLTFTPGQTTRTLTVPVIGETVPEANETFFVNLSGAANATISDNQGVGTITNDDVPVTVGPGTLPNGAVATAYSQTITASGGTGPYGFALTAGALPAGLTLSAGGALTGTPTAGGSFNFTVTATDSSAFPGPFSGSQAYTLTIAAPTLALPATPLAGGTLGVAYSAAITPASGGSAPYAYAVTAGALPGGLTLNASTGAISGTPSALGTFNFSITATDSSTGTGPYTATQAYAITVIDEPPTGGNSSLTVAYNAPATNVPLTLSGGAPTSLAIGTPPANGTAIVSGTTITYQPSAGYAGPDSFTYTATNSGGTSAPATVSVTVQDAVITITASGGFAATVAAPYTQTFSFNGGTPPWSGYQVTNLPAGVAITGTTANTVTISGTPTQAGTFNLNVSATDGSTGNGPYTVGQAFTLTVTGPMLTLAPASPALNATYATAFTQAFSTTGGVGPYTYAVSGTLPAGVSLSGATLSGTPTAPGSYSFTITATDTGASGVGAPFTTSRAYTLEVAAPTLTLTPATLPASTAGTVYTLALSASGGVAPYSFALSAGTLPAGLTLTSSGTLAGTPTEAGTFNVSVTATDTYGQAVTRAYALEVAQPTLTLAPGGSALPNATAGAAFSQSLVVSGGIAPYTATLSGALPTGITFNPATLAFAGTPTESGTFTFDVTATDSTGGTPGTVTATYSLTVLVPTLSLSPETVQGATAGVTYTQTFVATGGVAPYQYTLSAGTLPAGLTLDTATGQLAGTPTQAGSFDFSVTATDSTAGTAATTVRAYTLAVSAPVIGVDPDTLPTALQSVEYTQALSARGGTAPYTFTLDAGTLPTGMTLSAEGALSGTPSATGSFEVTIRATDALGFSGTRTYALTVIARPDPTRDPEVRGLLEAQAEATRRFAAGQIANFQQRLEQLHGGATAEGMRNGVSFTTRERCQDNRAYTDLNACGASARAADARRNAAGEQRLSGGASPDEEGTASQADAAAFGFWTGGTLRSGNFDGRAGRNSLDFETEGVSAGADRRFRPDFVAGLGFGYGQDSTAIGNNGTQLDGKAWTLAMYGSYHPGERLFVDGLLGYQRLSYDLERFVTANDGRVRGSRDGDQWFASLSIGTALTRGAAQLTPYARVDAMRATLDPYTERGDAIYALTYGEQDVDTTTGNIGLRMAFRRNATWGAFSPQARLEYQHDFTADSRTFMQYADLLGPTYATSVSGYDRSRFMLGLGVLFDFGAYSLQVDYRGVVGSSDQRDNALQVMFQAGR